MKKHQAFLFVVVVVILSMVFTGMGLGTEAGEAQHATETHAAGVMPDTWAATDALGRTLPTAEEAGPRGAGRFVGIFYFLTHFPGGHKPNNLAKILAQDPDILSKPELAAVGPARPVLLGRAALRLLPLDGPLGAPPPRQPAGRRRNRHPDLRHDQPNHLSRRLHEALRGLDAGPQGRRAHAADLLHGQHAGGRDGPGDLRRPLQARTLQGPLVPLAGQAADDLRSEGGQSRGPGSSSRCARPIGRSRWSTRTTSGTGNRPIRRSTATTRTPPSPKK